MQRPEDCFPWFVRTTPPHASWFMRVRVGLCFNRKGTPGQRTTRVHILSLDHFIHYNPGSLPSAAQISIAQVNRCYTFNQSSEETTLGTISRPLTPHFQSIQRVLVTIFKLVKQSTQSLIQLKSRHYGLMTSPTLTYLICWMRKRGKQ